MKTLKIFHARQWSLQFLNQRDPSVIADIIDAVTSYTDDKDPDHCVAVMCP
jgi:hypothetical protein